MWRLRVLAVVTVFFLVTAGALAVYGFSCDAELYVPPPQVRVPGPR